MRSSTGGSINEVGFRFQSFRINDLEMVGLTGIEPVSITREKAAHRRGN